MAPLRVGLDARLMTATSGGVEQVIIGLASGLSQLADGDEEYLFLTHAGADAWLRPYVAGPCRILPGPPVPALRTWRRRLGAALPPVRAAWRIARARLATLPLPAASAIPVPRSDGTIERAGIGVMHFLTQQAFLTDVPSIYHPWDLQHLHFPQFFPAHVRRAREVRYRAFCQQARIVSVASVWGKQDLMRHYGLPEEKVQVVPIAPVLTAYPTPSAADVAAVRRRYALPEAFAFYPAQTWPHKNHLGLLEALALLRDRHGLTVPLVCSGAQNEFYPTIARRVRALRLEGQVRFLGFVSPLELQCLYRLCRCLVFPSLFEGWGLPVTEAFLAGVPVACANVTSLPEVAGDAALLFDPTQPAALAAALARLWEDAALRAALVARGRARVASYSWVRTARLFRAHYRRIAGRPLTDEDRALLGAGALVGEGAVV